MDHYPLCALSLWEIMVCQYFHLSNLRYLSACPWRDGFYAETVSPLSVLLGCHLIHLDEGSVAAATLFEP